jgi:hypothetical protein
MARIEERRPGKSILPDVFFNRGRRFHPAGINEVKVERRLGKFFRNPSQLRSVSIRDRAIRSDKQKDVNLSVLAQGLCQIAAEVRDLSWTESPYEKRREQGRDTEQAGRTGECPGH